MRASALRGLVPALVVLALVGVVAIAAAGSTPPSTGDSRPPSELLLDTLFSLSLLLLVPAVVILVYGLLQRKEIAHQRRAHGTRSAGLVAFISVFTAIVYLRLRGWEGIPFNENDERIFVEELPPSTPLSPGQTQPAAYEPEFAWIPVLVVVLLVAIAVGAALVASRRRARPDEEAIGEAIVAMLEDTLEDLGAEKDPRRAVIAAYARLERTFAAHRLARHAAETPEEYLIRILPRLEIDPRSARRLTNLFTRAKFSHHDVGESMKDEAIAALVEVRDELQAATRLRMEQSAQVVAERPATS